MRPHLHRSILALAALLAAGACARADAPESPGPAWRDSFVARLEALALLQSLNADLLSHDSATLTLDRWCAAHHLADPATVTAERVHDVDKAPTAAQRELLHVGPAEPVGYRRVRLHCGVHVLSEADNWYVPGRLTADMNRNLDHSDIAFGRAIQALKFQRHTLGAALLWRPLPADWETKTTAVAVRSGALEVPPYVLQHTAVLSLPDGTPLSTLTETYTSEVLAFPQPRAF
jgi:chorismate-pyruvate lyase